MSDYKKLMGYGKKKKVTKKVTKKESKSKVNEVLKNIKEEFNIKEVGASQEYHKLRKNFEKTYKAYWDSVNDFQLALKKKGLNKEAMNIHRKYSKNVLGFHAWLRQSIRKLL